MSFGERVLDWLVRHRERAVPHGDRDVVLVWEHPALADTPAQGNILGESWHIAHVTGEITLRAALPEAGRLVAIVPPGFVAPADLAGWRGSGGRWRYNHAIWWQRRRGAPVGPSRTTRWRRR